MKRVLSDVEKHRPQALYTEGMPLNAIAADLGIYKARIHREIAAMSIERRSERKPETVPTPDQTDTLLKLYFNTDTPLRVVCEQFALPESSLYRLIDRHGGGLPCGALHEVAGGANGAVEVADAALFAAGIAPHKRGKVLWCITWPDL